MFKTSAGSFYKTVVRKSTSMSNENDAEQESFKERSRQPDQAMPGDVARLISE
jgi:hypothetical protein